MRISIQSAATLCVVVLGSLWCVAAFAQDLDAACAAEPSLPNQAFNAGYCHGVVMTALNDLGTMSPFELRRWGICLPGDAKRQTLSDAMTEEEKLKRSEAFLDLTKNLHRQIVAYLGKKPEAHNDSPSVVAYRAVATRYPCK